MRCSATSVWGLKLLLKLLVYEASSCEVLQARVEELSRVEHALRADLSFKEQEAQQLQQLQQQVGEGARVEHALRADLSFKDTPAELLQQQMHCCTVIRLYSDSIQALLRLCQSSVKVL